MANYNDTSSRGYPTLFDKRHRRRRHRSVYISKATKKKSAHTIICTRFSSSTSVHFLKERTPTDGLSRLVGFHPLGFGIMAVDVMEVYGTSRQGNGRQGGMQSDPRRLIDMRGWGVQDDGWDWFVSRLGWTVVPRYQVIFPFASTFPFGL